jgi:DnaJ-domain-containing protein 1
VVDDAVAFAPELGPHSVGGRSTSIFVASMQSHYETLGVPQAAKPEQIKRCYRTLVKRFHPDLFPSGSDAQYDAGERLRNINAAYAVLSNPQRRASYDAKLSKRKSTFAEPKPEYCHKCRRPTLYWRTDREKPLCNDCGKTAD